MYKECLAVVCRVHCYSNVQRVFGSRPPRVRRVHCYSNVQRVFGSRSPSVRRVHCCSNVQRVFGSRSPVFFNYVTFSQNFCKFI